VGGIGMQGTHMQEPRHLMVEAGLQDALAEVDVDLAKARAFITAFVQYADQVNGDIATFQQFLAIFGLVGIALDQLKSGQNHQPAIALWMPCQDANVITGINQLTAQMQANKAGATKESNSFLFQGFVTMPTSFYQGYSRGSRV
jgi:hypothetical protein